MNPYISQAFAYCMSSKLRRKKPRFNLFSVGRAAVLFRRGAGRSEVVQHYLQKYGEKWGIHSAQAMEKYLFTPPRGMRPNFSKMFENRYPTEIEDNFADYFKRKKRWTSSKRASTLLLMVNPAYRLNREAGVRKREENPDFIRKRLAHLSSPAFREAQRRAASDEMKRRWSDPVKRAQMTEKNRKQSSEALKARWGIPEERAKMLARSRKPRKKRNRN